MAQGKLPLIEGSATIKGYFDETQHSNNSPGFEMELRAVYRDAPIEVLAALETEVADMHQNMAEYGEDAVKLSRGGDYEKLMEEAKKRRSTGRTRRG